MVKFGPSGNDELFYAEGYTTSVDAPQWLKNKGLDLYEYSFGRGITISEEKAKEIGEKAKEYGIQISVHAPYFINFANSAPEARQKNIQYVLNSLKYLRLFGGHKLVIHPGSQLKMTREEAMKNILDGVEELVERVYLEGYSDMFLCFETMGKSMQMGSVAEIIEICKIDKILMPTVDFGHVNAVTQGTLKTEDDFRKIIDSIKNELGEFKVNNFHIHFSKIEYTDKGEKVHLTLEDQIYGPNFEPLAKIIKEYGLSPTIISESKNIMAQDALKLKQIYDNTEV
ncbi:MAG: TIM barrel protein [Spirochaetales bacterium]